jgi:hypothetical protein
MGNFFKSFFYGTDAAIVEGRLYLFSKDASDYLQFHGKRFGLSIGPKLDDLDRNWMMLEKKTLHKKIRKSVLESVSATQDAPMTGERLLMYIADDIIEHHSFKHILSHNVDCAKTIRTPVIDPTAVMGSVYQSLQAKYLGGIVNKDVLVIGGTAYTLEETESPKRTHLKIGRRTYALSRDAGIPIEDILKQREDMVDDEIHNKTRDNKDLEQFLKESLERNIDKLSSSNDQYNAENNTGFHRNGKDTYIYTKTPSYILYERVNKIFYAFPPAKIGVQIEAVDDNLFLKLPVVIDGYLHPAVPCSQPYTDICFQYVDIPNLSNYNIRSQVCILLYTGCRMLMELYCSTGGAWKNLNNPDTAAEFSHMVIPADKADMRIVTNMKRCMEVGESA